MGKVKGKKGFTLIEVITVCVIIAIAASIAVPNFSNIVKRNQMRALVQSAQWAEDATMALTGLQYARTDAGNPLFVNASPFFVNESDEGDQYVYVINDKLYKGAGKDVFRVTPANIAADGALRKSAGLTELYKRTMNDLPVQPWSSPYGTINGKVTCSLYFDLGSSNISNILGGVIDPAKKFVKYNFVYSEYFMNDGARQFAMYHDVKMHTDDGAFTGTPVADKGNWNIYEFNNGSLSYYGTIQ